MDNTTNPVESLLRFVKSLNKKSLQPLINELKDEPSPFSVYYDRTEAHWKEFYGLPGVDIHTFLHKQEQATGIDY
jgi:hypothetical protein